MILFSYSLRNLSRSPWKSFQMLAGAFLVIFLIISASSLNRGIVRCLSTTGSPENVILLGAGSEESLERSEIPRVAPDIVATNVKGVKQILDKPAVSAEVYFMGMIKQRSGKTVPALLRGVTANAINVRDNVVIIAGRFPNTGEIMVGSQAAKYMGLKDEDLSVGETLIFDKIEYKISGIFSAKGTMTDAELWMDINDLLTATKRETVSCGIVKLDNPDNFRLLSLFCAQRLDLEISAITEPDYYASLSKLYAPIRIMVWIGAFLVASAAVFGGMNTLYAAMVARRRELATLQAIGYTRTTLFITMLIESLIINLIGALFALTISGFFFPNVVIPFSTGVFQLVFDNQTIIIALFVAFSLSIIGIIMPAWACLKPSIVSSLRSR